MCAGLVEEVLLETSLVCRVSGSAFTASQLSGSETPGSWSKSTGHGLISKEMVSLYPAEGSFHLSKGTYS